MSSDALTPERPGDKPPFHLARRFLWAYYHGEPYTLEGQQEWLKYCVWKAANVRGGTPQEIQDAAQTFGTDVLDRARHGAWLRLTEDALWRTINNDYLRWLLGERRERFAENHHDICPAGQIARQRPDDQPLTEVTTGYLSDRLPSAAEIGLARNIFLDGLDSFNSTEWPEGDRQALAEHMLAYYDGLDFGNPVLSGLPEGHPVGRDERWELQHRYGLKQKEIGALFGLQPDVACRLRKKAAEERRPASGPGDPVDDAFRAMLLKRLDRILTNPERFRS